MLKLQNNLFTLNISNRCERGDVSGTVTMFVRRATSMHQDPSALVSFWVNGGGWVILAEWRVGKDKEDISSCGLNVAPLPQLFKQSSQSISWISLSLLRYRLSVKERGTPTLESCSMYSSAFQNMSDSTSDSRYDAKLWYNMLKIYHLIFFSTGN